VCLRDLGEREGLRDRQREALGLNQPAYLGQHVDRANPLDKYRAVGDGLGAERAQIVVVGRTGGAITRATHHGQLNRGAADTPEAPLTTSMPPRRQAGPSHARPSRSRLAAPAKSSDGGIGAQLDSTASAAPFGREAKHAFADRTSATPSPSSSTTPAAS
jgi:hypothetical protein